MPKYGSYKTLEETLFELLEVSKAGPITIQRLLEILSGKGRWVLMILLTLPFCQPIQIPGFSTPFGFAIALIGFQSMVGRKNLWLPKKILKKSLSPALLGKIANKSLKLVQRVKGWIYPRLEWVSHHPIMKVSNSILIIIMGIFLALPIPIPFTNLSAGWSLLMLGIGILEDDGILVLIGYLIAILTFSVLIFLGFSLNYFFTK